MGNFEYCNFNWGTIKNASLYTEGDKVVTVKDLVEEQLELKLPHSNKKVHKLDLLIVNDTLTTCGFDRVGDIESECQARRRFYKGFTNFMFKHSSLCGYREYIKYDVRFQVALDDDLGVEYKYLEQVTDAELEHIVGLGLNISFVHSKTGLEIPIILSLGVPRRTSKDIYMDEFNCFRFSGELFLGYLVGCVDRIKQGILFGLDRFDFDEFYERTYDVGVGLSGTKQYNKVLEEYLELERKCRWICKGD